MCGPTGRGRVRRTHAIVIFSSLRARLLAPSLLSTLPFIPRHTRYTVRPEVRTTPGDLQSRG